MDKLAREYVETVLLSNEIPAVKERLLKHRAEGHTVVIASGGYMEYLKHYAARYGVDNVVATELEVIDGRFTGRIKGADCMGVNKLLKLKQTISVDNFNLNASFAYSDDYSDLPLLSLVGHPTVVVNGQVPA